jgi:WD40 repeat protein
MSDPTPTDTTAAPRTEPVPPPPTAAAPPGEPGLPAWAGRYRLEGEVARGGMGVVYRAHDADLGRTLAVKVLLPCHAGDPALAARFLEEARITGQLQHPGVPPVHDVGRLGDGRPFLAMRLVKGQTLARLLAERPSPAEGLPHLVDVFASVCQALAYAHSRGVVHRDLKPSNVMVGAFGEVQVMDWGLAKVLDQAPTEAAPGAGAGTLFTTRASAGWQTEAGAVLGTPAYMAPEQARGELNRVDERSDVFGLGAVLCHLLTGRPPYHGPDAQRQARQADLADAFAGLDRCGADAGLIALTKRCLAAEPGGRPRHAGEVAQAVAAYQGEVQERLRQAELGRAAAQARATAERRARRLTVGLAALLVLVFLAGFAGVSWQWRRAEGEYRRAVASAEAERRTACARAVALAYAEWRAGNSGRAQEALSACSPDLRGWEWHYLGRLFRSRQLAALEGHPGGVLAVCFSPDGRRVASAGADGVVRVWDRRAPRQALALRGHATAVTAVCFSPDGRRLAGGSADGAVRVWDAAGGGGVVTWRGHAAGVTGLAFDPTGRRLASTGSGGPWTGELKLWDPAKGKPLAGKAWPNLLAAVCFGPDGRRLATAGRDGSVVVWDPATLKPLGTYEGQTRRIDPWAGVAFSADGKWVAAGSPTGLVRVWDTATGREAFSALTPTQAGVAGLAFAGPDGRILAAATADNTVQGWYTMSGKPAFTLRGQTRPVMSVACSPDGKVLASGSLDGTVRLWDLTRRDDDLTLRAGNEGVTAAAFAPDGGRLASAARDRVVKVHDVASGKAVMNLRSLPGAVNGLAFGPDGRLAGAGADGMVRVWEVASGRERLCLRGPGGPAHAVAISPGGGRLASGGADGVARVWDAATGREVLALRGHNGPVHAVAFSPDGRHLASGGADEAVRVWDAATGREVLALRGHNGPVHAVAFGPGGRHLATAGQDEAVRVWDAATGELAHTLRGHAGAVRGLAYGPRGRLASAGDDRAVRIWDAEGRELLALRGHTAAVRSLAFSPDGHRLASASDDGTIKIWDGTPLGGAGGTGSAQTAEDGAR